MEEDTGTSPPQGVPMRQDRYFDAAIRAVRDKKPPPETDFTLHTMDDGTEVNTLERVCKGRQSPLIALVLITGIHANAVMHQTSKHRPSMFLQTNNSGLLKIDPNPTSNSSSNISTVKVA